MSLASPATTLSAAGNAPAFRISLLIGHSLAIRPAARQKRKKAASKAACHEKKEDIPPSGLSVDGLAAVDQYLQPDHDLPHRVRLRAQLLPGRRRLFRAGRRLLRHSLHL